MTRKDYVLIAEALNQSRLNMETLFPDEVRKYGYGSFNAAELIGYALCRDNPRFDMARFMQACGYVWGK